MSSISALLQSPKAERYAKQQENKRMNKGLEISDNPMIWLNTIYPEMFSFDFAPYHISFWNYIMGVTKDGYHDPFFLSMARGHGKTSSLEMAVVYLCATARRKFVLYCMRSQDMADKSLSSISSLIEHPNFSKYYPLMAEKQLNKYGTSKGWRRNMLQCANGAIIQAIGVDTAVRGSKFLDQRPDLIIVDDVDAKTDSLKQSNKVITTLTTSLFPAISTNGLIVGAQNLIIPDGFFGRLFGKSDYEATYLANRILEGAHPAIEGLAIETEIKDDGKPYHHIVGGYATWHRGGQGLKIEERNLNLWGISAYKSESQHEMLGESGQLFDHVVYRYCEYDDIPDLITIECWVDPAITDTDQSDSNAICIGGVAENHDIYIIHSWEKRTSPLETLKYAILQSIKYRANVVGIETNQGGKDLWKLAYEKAWNTLVEEGAINTTKLVKLGIISHKDGMIKMIERKISSSVGSKAMRVQKAVLPPYEKGEIVHVLGTHDVLERALYRFPIRKPYDLVDAVYHLVKRMRVLRRYKAT